LIPSQVRHKGTRAAVSAPHFTVLYSTSAVQYRQDKTGTKKLRPPACQDPSRPQPLYSFTTRLGVKATIVSYKAQGPPVGVQDSESKGAQRAGRTFTLFICLLYAGCCRRRCNIMVHANQTHYTISTGSNLAWWRFSLRRRTIKRESSLRIYSSSVYPNLPSTRKWLDQVRTTDVGTAERIRYALHSKFINCFRITIMMRSMYRVNMYT
jgi:hypothetical protein